MHVAKAYAAEFSNKHTGQEVTEKNTNPQVFVPASGARYRPLKRKSSIEGRFVNKKKLQKGRDNVYKTIHVGLGGQLKEAKTILDEENADVSIDFSPPCGQELPKGNFWWIVFLAAFGVRKCQGCKG